MPEAFRRFRTLQEWMFLQNAEIQALLADPYALPFGYDMDQATVVSAGSADAVLLADSRQSEKRKAESAASIGCGRRKGKARQSWDFEQKWRRHGAETEADEKEEMSLEDRKKMTGTRQAKGKASISAYGCGAYEFSLGLQEELVQRKIPAEKGAGKKSDALEQSSIPKIAEMGQTFLLF